MLPFLVPEVDGAELFAFFLFLLVARASPVCHWQQCPWHQPGWKSLHRGGTSAWADLWPACISADDRAGYDVADAACRVVLLTHRAPHAGYGGASGRTVRHSHGSLLCSALTLMAFGFLDTGERRPASTDDCDRGRFHHHRTVAQSAWARVHGRFLLTPLHALPTS